MGGYSDEYTQAEGAADGDEDHYCELFLHIVASYRQVRHRMDRRLFLPVNLW
jgi:hypothetical protein